MRKIKTADASNIGFKPIELLPNIANGFYEIDYDEKAEILQHEILAVIKPPKIIRLYFCFGCEKNFAAKKMSNTLSICRTCFFTITAQSKGKIARNNFATKALNNFQKFLRRRICQ